MRRYAAFFQRIEEDHPAFWTELADVMERRRATQWTTEGVIVRSWPRTRDAVVQVGHWCSRCDAQTQTVDNTGDAATQTEAEAGGRARTRDVAVQAGAGAVSRGAPDARDALAEEPYGRPRRPSHSTLPEASRSPREGCWNCSAEDHRANAYPRPQQRVYCFRCEHRGVTIRECPDCREDWRAQGPYIPDRGHPGEDPPRRGLRGYRPGAHRPY